MRILGLNTMENASACLVIDGRIIAAAEEERFTRIKHQEGVPLQAIRYCLQEGKIDLTRVDIVALNWQPWRLARRFFHVLKFGLTSPKHFLIKAKRGAHQVAGNEWGRMISLPRQLPQLLGVNPRKCKYGFKYIDHHLCHAASAFYPSPFDEAAILTLDGAGEDACITFNQSRNGQIEQLGAIKLPHSLGHLYSAFTAFLGFRPCSGEGKIMGLAPYGEDTYSNVFNKMVMLCDRGKIKIDFKLLDYHLARANIFTSRTLKALGPHREKESRIEDRHMNIAASLQKILEKAALHIADHLYRETGLKKLCLAGGVALNASMNQRILESSPFEQIFIQPAAGDAGTSLGAALAAEPPSESTQRYVLNHVYLGPQYTNKYIRQTLGKYKLHPRHFDDIEQATAQLLAKGKIVGRFQGGMEFGPRALGNRSILADPRQGDMKDILNHRVKHRESFRPFAPAVLEEQTGNYFRFRDKAPFMTIIADVLPQARQLIPAVVHVDGTARLQTVSKETSPRFYNLIDKFYHLTNVPVILNTSFNIRGEPIVCTPEDAVACYLGTGMDALAIGDFLVVKNNEDMNICRVK